MTLTGLKGLVAVGDDLLGIIDSGLAQSENTVPQKKIQLCKLGNIKEWFLVVFSAVLNCEYSFFYPGNH